MADALRSVMIPAPERAPKPTKPNAKDEREAAREDLDRALARADSADRRQKLTREALADGAEAALYTGETLVTNLLASTLEGYVGTDKLKVAGVDPRPVLGLTTSGYGLYRILTRQSGGGHLLALGAGPLNSWVASLGQRAGQSARQRWGGGAQAQVAQAPLLQLTPSVQGGPQAVAELAGPPRVVLLTPQSEPPRRDRARERARDRGAQPRRSGQDIERDPNTHRRFPKAG